MSPKRTMRIALAMRGGVSLAIWIGGALAEIDVFRRAFLPDAKDVTDEADRRFWYRRLLAGTAYDGVEIDILSGASAGGLNAVLYGVAQTCGATLDDVAYSTWVEDGALWKLLHRQGFGGLSAPLRGDAHFFAVMRVALRLLYAGANQDGAAGRVNVELAATLLADGSSPELVNRARFSFASRAGAGLGSGYRGIPKTVEEADSDVGVAALDRLALAARATSSFPGAFEPARVFSFAHRARPAAVADTNCVPTYFGLSGTEVPGQQPHVTNYPERPTEFDINHPATAAYGLGVNMAAAFPYATWWTRPDSTDIAAEGVFTVIDGGVYDNIPIDRALQAIAQAPASGPSERHLWYLDPEPPSHTSVVRHRDSPSTVAGWVPVILGAKRLQQRAETADTELGLIRAHNDAVLATRGRLEALAAALRAGSTDTANLVDVVAYTQRRIATDAERIAALLFDPWARLSRPPFPGGNYQPPGRADWALRVKNVVSTLYNSDIPLDGDNVASRAMSLLVSRDVIAVTEQVQVLLGWTRELEDLRIELTQPTFTDDKRALFEKLPGVLSSVKGALYRWLTLLQRAHHISVDAVLVAVLDEQRCTDPDRRDPDPKQLDELLQKWLRASQTRQRCLQLPDNLAKLLTPHADDVEGAFLVELSRPGLFEQGSYLLPRLHDDENGPSTQPSAGATQLLAQLRNTLVAASSAVVSSLTENQSKTANGRTAIRRWNESMYAQLYLPPWSGAGVAPIARLFTAAGIPDTASIVRFDRITSDEPINNDADLTTLAAGARAVQLRAWLRRTPNQDVVNDTVWDGEQSGQGLITSDAKLAGNAVSRFGGFALTQWRRNDWYWGRRDAAAALTRILIGAHQRPERNVDEADADYDGRSERARDATERLRDDALSALRISLDADEHADQDEREKELPLLTSRVGAQTLDAVQPSYRFALASRLVPLLYRGLLPEPSTTLRTRVVAWVAQGLLIRPIALLAPLAADPLRALAATAVILASATLLGVSDSPRPLHVIYNLGFLIVGAVMLVQAIQSYRRWRGLHRLLREAPHTENWKDLARDPARLWLMLALGGLGVLVMVGGVVLMVELIRQWPSGNPHRSNPGLNPPSYREMPLEAFLAATTLLTATAVWFRRRINTISVDGAEPKRSRAARTTLTLAALAGLLAVTLTVSCGAVVVALTELARPTTEAGAAGPPPATVYQTCYTVAVAVASTGTLTAISLAGWVRWRSGKVIFAVVATIVVGASAQTILDISNKVITANHGWLDLLPTLSWLVILGNLVAWLPCRDAGYGDPDIRSPATDHAPTTPTRSSLASTTPSS